MADPRSMLDRLFCRLFAGSVYAIAFWAAYTWGGPYAAVIAAGFAIGSLNERIGDVEHG